MRTKYIFENGDASVHIESYRDLSKDPLADSTMDTLASANLISLKFEWADGSSTTYMAIEYECGICGKYGHEERACPLSDGVEFE